MSVTKDIDLMFVKGVNRFHRKHITKMEFYFILVIAMFTGSCWVCIFEPFGSDASDIAAAFALISLLAVLFLSLLVFGRGYCCFHPYFQRRLNRESKVNTYGRGQSIAAKLDELDKLADEHGIRTLSSFGYTDSFQNSNVIWHSPEAGISTITWLIDNNELEKDLRSELVAIRTALEVATQSNTPFCFHMKFADGTNVMEHEQREGSYW